MHCLYIPIVLLYFQTLVDILSERCIELTPWFFFQVSVVNKQFSTQRCESHTTTVPYLFIVNKPVFLMRLLCLLGGVSVTSCYYTEEVKGVANIL